MFYSYKVSRMRCISLKLNQFGSEILPISQVSRLANTVSHTHKHMHTDTPYMLHYKRSLQLWKIIDRCVLGHQQCLGTVGSTHQSNNSINKNIDMKSGHTDSKSITLLLLACLPPIVHPCAISSPEQ